MLLAPTLDQLVAETVRFALSALKSGGIPLGGAATEATEGGCFSRRALRLAVRSGMPRWQDRLFIGLARSSNDATDYFQIPTDRVVEVGTQVTV